MARQRYEWLGWAGTSSCMNTQHERTQLRIRLTNASCARTISIAALPLLSAPIATFHAWMVDVLLTLELWRKGARELPAAQWSRKSICCHCAANCTRIVGATAAQSSAAGIASLQMPRLWFAALWRVSVNGEKEWSRRANIQVQQEHNKARPDRGSSPALLPSSAGLPCETVAHNTTQLTAPVRQST